MKIVIVVKLALVITRVMMNNEELKYLIREKFNAISDPVVAKNYDGFIDQDGYFYASAPKFKHEPTHADLALDILTYVDILISKKKGGIINKLKELAFSYVKDEYERNTLAYQKPHVNPTKELVEKLRFMYYGHSQNTNRKPIIEINDAGIASKEQKYMIASILKLNNETSFLPNDLIEAKREDVHQRYVDDYIVKRIMEERNK